MHRITTLIGLFAVLTLTSACDSSPELSADAQAGQTVWEVTCKACHSTGLGNAPIIGDKDAWQARIAKGKQTLESNAINGFSGGLMGGEMPAKGGNASLTDQQVKQAVAYMIELSK